MATVEFEGEKVDIIPCPICGNAEDIGWYYDRDNDEGELFVIIQCDCGAFTEAHTFDECVKLWNKGKAD